MTYQCGTTCETEYDFYDIIQSRLMYMTMLAHKEVLFDKIKEQIEQQEGAKLEEIAKLLVNASKAKMKTNHDMERTDEELNEKLREHFES